MRELLVFDFFGTLVETRDSFSMGCKMLGRELSLDPVELRREWTRRWNIVYKEVVSSEEWRNIRWVREESLRGALSSLKVGFDRVDVSRAVHSFLKVLVARSEMYGGAKNLLEWAKPRTKLGIISNSDSGVFWPIFNRLGIEKYVEREFIRVSEEERSYKPDTKMLLSLMEEANVGPGGTVFVGDSNEDVLMGRRAGALSVLVDRGKEVSRKPHLVVKRLDELIPLLITS